MARTNDPNSATSEFFVNLVQGMEVVDAIGAVATGSVNGVADVPLSDVTIKFAVQSQ